MTRIDIIVSILNTHVRFVTVNQCKPLLPRCMEYAYSIMGNYSSSPLEKI